MEKIPDPHPWFWSYVGTVLQFLFNPNSIFFGGGGVGGVYTVSKKMKKGLF